ncbi:MAG: plasmid pRiA4b ORF-3 family protein, partial [Bacteroidales bacterium]
MSNSSSQIYQIKVFLNRIRPMIWRRILVSGDTNLSDLHDILQMVMGWENDHLHEFKIDRKIYDDSDDWEFIDLGWDDS